MIGKINLKVASLLLGFTFLSLIFFRLVNNEIIQSHNATQIVVYLALAQLFLAFVTNAAYDMIKGWLGISE